MRPSILTAGFRTTGLALVASLLPLLAGVGCCGPMACGPIGCGNLCGMNSCDGPLLGLGAGCGHGSCNGCGNSGCSSCQDGCGELYVDEWINTPPQCDNCDNCGNHHGQTCQACRPILSGFASLWGYRRDPGCGGVSTPPMTCGCNRCSSGCDSCGSCEGGCDSCGGGCSSCGHGGGGETMMDGEYIVEEPYAMSGSRPVPMQPTHAAQIVEAKPSIKPYQPQRTKQIFRPKTNVAGAPAPRSNGY